MPMEVIAWDAVYSAVGFERRLWSYLRHELDTHGLSGRVRLEAAGSAVLFVVASVGYLALGDLLMECVPRVSIVTSQLIIATSSALISPSISLLYALPALLHAVFLNVHVPLPHTTALLNSTLQSEAGFALLARQQSLTGYVSVLENNKDPFRVLRCDHSLLGGEWLLGDTAPGQVREPVYTVFVLLEAVRLVQEQDPSETLQENEYAPDDSSKRALVIGLGVGTSATALITHGIDTTIVEIDPVVYQYAKDFFDLPPKHSVFLGDAVDFVHAIGQTTEFRQYDYIVHDVFTGGAEPAELFTVEFLTGLRDLLKSDGVVAINYAGDLLLPSSRMIIRTIKAVFPTCRIFRDDRPPDNPASKLDFTNMVVFCTKSSAPLFFRRPREADFLGSEARRNSLYPQFEIESGRLDRGTDKEDILSVENVSVLSKGQEESAAEHWRIMRTVLPDAVWELY
ncbi:MAG: hypothetical protein M4579_003469 [Chaenotheca gracillima]|nr:MAG: hypothetical protein M4579_003469 [Chaenotheca gracillima]